MAKSGVGVLVARTVIMTEEARGRGNRGALSPAPPVFVLAPARSCSSVVVAMMGGHPKLYAFPELRLFRVSHVAGLLVDPPPGRGMPAQERAAGLLRTLAELHEGSQSPDAVDRAGQWLQAHATWDVSQVMDRLLLLIDPLVGVEKSPETSLSWDALLRVRTAYPQARFLHLVRHPWATVASMRKAWGGLTYWHVDRDSSAEYCANLWLEQHRRITDFTSQLDPQQHRRVRAEQVVNQPGSVLPSICRWLGLPDDHGSLALMSSPERSPYARPGPSNAQGGFDPGFLQEPFRRGVDTPVTIWPPSSLHIASSTAGAVAGLAIEFGYQADDTPATAALSHPAGRSRYRLVDGTVRRRRA